jgi:hypothetical protein
MRTGLIARPTRLFKAVLSSLLLVAVPIAAQTPTFNPASIPATSPARSSSWSRTVKC